MLRIHSGTGKGTKLISRVQEAGQITGGGRVAMEMESRGYNLLNCSYCDLNFLTVRVEREGGRERTEGGENVCDWEQRGPPPVWTSGESDVSAHGELTFAEQDWVPSRLSRWSPTPAAVFGYQVSRGSHTGQCSGC